MNTPHCIFVTGLVLTTTMLAAFGDPANAGEYRITGDHGGNIALYEDKWRHVAASADKVVIDGLCQSACTMVIGIIPRDRICVTPRAVLAFHMGARKGRFGEKIADEARTQEMVQYYPTEVRNWISRHGGLHSLTLKYMHYGEMGWIKHCN